jgi:hypothetical protein
MMTGYLRSAISGSEPRVFVMLSGSFLEHVSFDGNLGGDLLHLHTTLAVPAVASTATPCLSSLRDEHEWESSRQDEGSRLSRSSPTLRHSFRRLVCRQCRRSSCCCQIRSLQSAKY